MSICPSKDIHSIYVDGELPEKFLPEYVSHIEVCPKCKGELEKLNSIKYSFKNDRENLNLSIEKIEKGYEKLEQLLDFKKVTTTFDFSRFAPMFNYLVPAIVASLIIVFFLPLALQKINKHHEEFNLAIQDAGIVNAFSEELTNISFNETDSLIESAEYLTSFTLGNIISHQQKNPEGNIYRYIATNSSDSIITVINYKNENFQNVYNPQKNLYNEVYTAFLGF